ncbi:acyl carrier protein [Streptomyces sp. NPDC001858]
MTQFPEREEVARIILERLRDKMFLDGVTADTNLIESGLIDSVGFIRMFVVLEEEFEFDVTAHDLSLDNFQTVRDITEFVIGKLRQGSDSEEPSKAGQA